MSLKNAQLRINAADTLLKTQPLTVADLITAASALELASESLRKIAAETLAESHPQEFLEPHPQEFTETPACKAKP